MLNIKYQNMQFVHKFDVASSLIWLVQNRVRHLTLDFNRSEFKFKIVEAKLYVSRISIKINLTKPNCTKIFSGYITILYHCSTKICFYFNLGYIFEFLTDVKQEQI
jgi:hypothetical protein